MSWVFIPGFYHSIGPLGFPRVTRRDQRSAPSVSVAMSKAPSERIRKGQRAAVKCPLGRTRKRRRSLWPLSPFSHLRLYSPLANRDNWI